MAQPRITVVGSSNTDLVVRVSHIPLPGETLLSRDVQRIPGGKGANQAVAARRLGGEVWFVGCLGDDGFGDDTAAHLSREGLRIDHVRRVAGVPSGIALIAVAEGGENSIIVAPGANAHLAIPDVDAASEAITTAHVVVTQLEIPLDTVRHAHAMARAAGGRVLHNPSPAHLLPADWLALVDILVCNETEAQALTGRAVNDVRGATSAAQQMHAEGAATVIVTLGAAGCLVFTDDTPHHVPAYAVTVVDTTAAGDAFIGALAVQLGQGGDLVAAARYASACSALTVTRPGAQTSLPTADEVARFLATTAESQP